MAFDERWLQLLPLESPRLVLRRFTRLDAEPFLAYRNDPAVARFQGWESCSLAAATAFVARQEVQEIGAPGHWLQIAIALKEGGDIIGDCALKISALDARQGTIGIALSRSCQGHGYAYEALSAASFAGCRAKRTSSSLIIRSALACAVSRRNSPK